MLMLILENVFTAAVNTGVPAEVLSLADLSVTSTACDVVADYGHVRKCD